jgi:hypothetical protein
MPDSRPLPQYGEYATPEEVAALRGTPLEPAMPAAAVAPADVAPRRPAVSGARRYDRPVTIALLLFGLINVVQYAPVLLDFDTFLERATVGTPTESIDFGDAARIGGFVLFGVTLVLLVVALLFSVLLLRRRRVAFWVPLTAGALAVLTWVLVLIAIVLQTPDALVPPGT